MHRKAIRDTVAAAMLAEGRFRDMTHVRAWAQGVDVAALPAFGVLTPDEPARRSDKDRLSREVALVVAVKRVGGDDIEDLLDADAALVERVVALSVPAVPDVFEHMLVRTQVALSGEGGVRAGSVVISFTVVVDSDLIIQE